MITWNIPILNPKKNIKAIGCEDSDSLWNNVRLSGGGPAIPVVSDYTQPLISDCSFDEQIQIDIPFPPIAFSLDEILE